jgi:hypothetical protein
VWRSPGAPGRRHRVPRLSLIPLESVQIAEAQRDDPTHTWSRGERMVDALLQQRAIRKARQCVMEGLMP